MSRKAPRRSKAKVAPIWDRSHLRGVKYEAAYMLVAAGELSDVEIAQRLDVELAALQEVKAKLYFQEKAESIRRTEATLREHNWPLVPAGKLAERLLGAIASVRANTRSENPPNSAALTL